MTGGGEGFCILKIPRMPDEPLTGFAGRSGQPVGPSPGGPADLMSLRARARGIEAMISGILRRIAALEATEKAPDDFSGAATIGHPTRNQNGGVS
jgi:hypothetical protein